MDNTNNINEILKGVLVELPLIVTCLAGIVVARTFWQRTPSASKYLIVACTISLGACVLYPVSIQVFWVMLKNSDHQTVDIASNVFAAVWSILRSVSYILLMVAVYVGRKSVAASSSASSLSSKSRDNAA